MICTLGGKLLWIVFSDDGASGVAGANYGLSYLILLMVSATLIILVSIIILTIFMGWFFTRRTGGITGDIIGGTSEIVEVLFLLVSYLVLNFIW